MGAILKQRKIFLTKEFELTDRSLKIKISKPLSFVEDEFNLEEISTKIIRHKSPKLIYIVFSIALLLGMIITIFSHFLDAHGSDLMDILFYAIPLIPILCLLYFTYENVVKLILNDKRYLSFYANSPNKADVNSFLESIKQEQKKYLLNRYAKPDPYLTDEQLSNNLQWLWDTKIINEVEFQELRNTLLPKFGGNLSVGFKFKPDSN